MKTSGSQDWVGTLRWVARHRGALRIVADAPLAELAERYDEPGLQTQLLAETIQRAWLFAPDDGAGEYPAAFRRTWERCGLGTEARDALDRWLAGQKTARTYALDAPLEKGLPTPLKTGLREILRGWEIADGTLVWVRLNDDPAMAPAGVLPFAVRLRHTREEPMACAANDSTPGLEGMVPGINAANTAARGWMPEGWAPGIRLHTLPGACGKSIGGPSAGFAMLLAHRLRRARLRVPALRVVASGALTPTGALAAVTAPDDYRRKDRLLTALGVRDILLPAPLPGGWPCGESLDARLDALVGSLRGFEESLPPNDLRYRIDEITTGMRYGGTDSRVARDELRRLLAGQLQNPGPKLADVRNEALLALAAAECHTGNAPAIDVVVEELLARDADIAPEYVAGALVHQAVALTDIGRYEGARALCDRALGLARTRDIGSPGVRQMVALGARGTRGQALTFLGMQPGQEMARNEGLDDLRAAAALACALDSPGHPHDLPRNLAYICLWYALHRSGEMLSAWQEAWDVARRHGSTTTQSHLRRYRWLAGYRAMKMGLPSCWPADGEFTPEIGDELWQRCTVLKYRGAARAAAGNAAGAREDFSEATRLAEENQPVLRFIGGTIALQAGESMHESAPDAAGDFLERATTIFREYVAWYAEPIAGSLWLARARAIREHTRPEADPQIFFPY